MQLKPNTRRVVALALSASLVLTPWSIPLSVAATSSQPQVVIALGNSESMDGNLSGAIMTGSGLVSGLSNSSSPVNYTVPSGFTPPISGGGTTTAPYTQTNSSGYTADNSPSRLNVAKAGLLQVLRQYLGGMNFALETYQTSGLSVNNTWVYYMSPAAGFQFASTLPSNGFTSYAAYQAFVASNPNASPAPTRWVVNPCYGTSSSSTVSSNCTSIAGHYASGVVTGSQYMQVSASSDDPDVNDVLYATSPYLAPVGLAYGGPSPSNPYSTYSLQQYNASTGNIASSYASALPSTSRAVAKTTYPTNAGFIPFSPEVLYAQRGFGFSATASPTAGTTSVPMSTVSSASTSTQLGSALAPFQTALAAETNNTGTSEVKASAGQSPVYGLLQGAKSAFTDGACAKYVILVTDGLPTMDQQGLNWPPLGSAAGQGYGVNAAFYGIGAQAGYGIVDDSTNTQGMAGALDVHNTNDQALIDAITAIQNLASEGIKTYVIGLGAGVDPSSNPAAYYVLNAMAIAGGTQHQYPATDVAGFSTALGQVAASISGAVIAAAPAVPGYVQNGSLAYLLASNNTYGSMQGYFEAFATDASGNVSSAPAWTLSMPASSRPGALFVDKGNGTAPMAFNTTNITASLLGNPTTPKAADIVGYTLDPSYNNGQYLAGRASGSTLGTITSQADRPVILSRPNNPNFLTSSSYISYAQANANRNPLVLFTSDDGFLYAVSAGSASVPGTLQWGWMPSVLLPQLKNYPNFQSQHYMNGGLRTVDSADGSGKWGTYVVGTAQGGALHYDLALQSCTGGGACTPTISKVWYDLQSGATSPPQAAPQAPAVWWDTSNVAYAAYFTTNGSTSLFKVMRLYDGSTSSVSVSFTPSSRVYVDASAQKLYVGDTAGNLWSFDLSTGGTAKTVTGPTLVGTLPNGSAAGAVRYLGYAQTTAGIYLWATTDTQVSVFKFTGGSVTIANTTSTGWSPWWWSSASGSGHLVVNSSGVGTMVTTTGNPGVASTGYPYWLDSGSKITDASAVEAATLIVPVTVTPTDSCGVPQAKYDFFDLDAGVFPQKKFYKIDKNYLTDNPVIGIGIAFSPVISLSSSGSAVVYGTASQNQQGKVGFQVASTTGIHVGPGVVGWAPVWLTAP